LLLILLALLHIQFAINSYPVDTCELFSTMIGVEFKLDVSHKMFRRILQWTKDGFICIILHMKYRLVSIYLQIVGDYSMYELGWILKKSYNSGMELLMHLKFGTLVVSTL